MSIINKIIEETERLKQKAKQESKNPQPDVRKELDEYLKQARKISKEEYKREK